MLTYITTINKIVCHFCYIENPHCFYCGKLLHINEPMYCTDVLHICVKCYKEKNLENTLVIINKLNSGICDICKNEKPDVRYADLIRKNICSVCMNVKIGEDA